MLLPLQLNNLLEPSDDVTVLVGVANLSLTTFQATISYDVNVSVNTAALTLTTNPATVTLDVNVDVGTAALSLQTFPASITATDGVVASTQKGGLTKKQRRRVRYMVEVDGEQIEAVSIQHAQQILEQARELAEESAETDVFKAIEAKRPVKVPVVKIRTAKGNKTASLNLQREVRDTRQAVERIYKRAEQRIRETQEIARLMHAKLQEEDDEEAILALLI